MISKRPARWLLALLLLGSAAAFDNQKSVIPISKETRLQLIRLLNAEYAFTMVPIPLGEKGLVVTPKGEIAPGDAELRRRLATYGMVAKPGERIQITSVEFKGKSILLEINGGPRKKAKWYQRITVSGTGGSRPIADGPDQIVRGSSLTIEFEHFVPEMTMEDLRVILKPILDFSVKSAAQAYTDTLPENVRNAIRDHQVLVGMNREMVTYAKGRPPRRIREKEGETEYEEWIYGQPPSDVEFVRFVGDQVVQLKIMKVDGEKIVRTTPEVVLDSPAVAQTTVVPPHVSAGPKDNAPTLRRTGEAPIEPGGVPVKKAPPLPPAPGKPDDPNNLASH